MVKTTKTVIFILKTTGPLEIYVVAQRYLKNLYLNWSTIWNLQINSTSQENTSMASK